MMETFFTVTEQTKLFLWACLVGVGLGIVYDIFRVARILISHKFVAVFVEDVLFTIFYAFCIFIYITEFSRGQIRFFIILGSLLGFVVYILTIGFILTTAIKRVSALIKKALARIFRAIFKPIKKFFRFIVQKMNSCFGNFSVNFKNKQKKLKKSLKQQQDLVYNNQSNIGKISLGSEKEQCHKKFRKQKRKRNPLS